MLCLGLWSPLERRDRLTHWQAFFLLWPLALLSATALLLDGMFPYANAFPLILRKGRSAAILRILFHLFAGLRMGRRHGWLVFLAAAPAVVHLVYPAWDMVTWAFDQQVVYIEHVEDVPRIGRRYPSHALAPLLVGARVRPARQLTLILYRALRCPCWRSHCWTHALSILLCWGSP